MSLAYGIGGFVNVPPNIVVPHPARDPKSTDMTGYVVGQLWVNTSTNTSFQLTSLSGNTATWTALGGGSSAVATLTGNSGGAVVPTAGNINVVGSGTLAFAGSGSTLTGSITPGTGLVSTINSLPPTAGNIIIAGTANEISIGNAGSTVTLSTPATFIAPGSIAATTTVTATLGNITATNGNVVLGSAGNKIISTNVATTTVAGANSFGSVTLVGGTATVGTTAVTTNSLIFIWRQSVGATGAAALGQLSVGTIVGSTSFDINAWSAADATALQASDVSVVGWMIVN